MKKLLSACFLVLVFSSSAVAKFDPSFKWSTIETPHFLVHYHQDGGAIALRAANIAEDVHERLTPRVMWAPGEKTHLVLVDAMDEVNGMSSPMPYNLIVLFLTQPVGEPGFGSVPYDDWMRLLITHEYTHTLQLDMTTGGFGWVMRKLFGRFYFPNALQPLWLIEGLATYEETEQTSGGRGRSAVTDMVLRMALLEESFPQLGRMAVFPDSWPQGQTPYLFGQSFTRFLSEKYGREKLADLSLDYSNRAFPFLVNSTARRTFGAGYGRLYAEWKKSLQERYTRESAEVRAEGATAATVLTQKGFITHAPAWSPDGTRIAYLTANGHEFPSIYVMNADGTGDRKLVENVSPATSGGVAPAWSPDSAKLYYTKLEVRGFNFYNDIYCYDFQANKETRLTRDARARDPHPSQDAAKIVFVTNRMGLNRLAVLDISAARRYPAEKKDILYLTQETEAVYETPRWSPDGTRIAVGVRDPGGHKDIRILDQSGGKIEEITHDRAIDGAPAWSSDGKTLFFSSDRTGIYNIFAYEGETKKLWQVTNVIGGAFSPVPSPDNKTLAFTSYSSRGYDIHAVPLDRGSWKAVEAQREPYADSRREEAPPEIAVKPYNPLPALVPRFWFPQFGYSKESGTMGGFLTFAGDPAERHHYYLTGLYGPGSGRTWHSLDYLYDGLLPTLHFHASDNDETFSDLISTITGPVDYVERRKTYGVSLIAPIIRTQRQNIITAGYRWRELSGLTDATRLGTITSPPPAAGVLASGRLDYIFSNSKRYDFSISPEDGRTVEAGYERFSKSIGSDYNLVKYSLDWHEFVGMPGKHHVLAVRAFGGTSRGETFPQGAYQLGGDTPGDITLSLEDDSVHLRGYPVNAFRGKSAGLAGLEYRFPIVNIERGSHFPVFMRRLHGAVFGEAGNAWDGAFQSSELKRAAGAELRLDMTLAYNVPVTFRLVFASGLDEYGESIVTLGLWTPALF